MRNQFAQLAALVLLGSLIPALAQVTPASEPVSLQVQIEGLTLKLDLRLFEFRLVDIKRQARSIALERTGLEDDLRQFRQRDVDAQSGAADQSDSEAILAEREIRRQQQLRTSEALTRIETLNNDLSTEDSQLTARVLDIRKRLDLISPPHSHAFAAGNRQ